MSAKAKKLIGYSPNQGSDSKNPLEIKVTEENNQPLPVNAMFSPLSNGITLI